jgi:penicillin-binding protein 2
VSTGWRLGVLGLIFIGLFSVLTLRLWQIQVTEAATYEEQAVSNRIDVARTPAPRGEIRDAKGRLLAGTRPALAIVVDGQLIPKDDQEQLVSSLAAFTSLAPAEVAAIIDDARARGDRITLVPELTDEQAVFLVEHSEEFPGVAVEPQPVRIYPEGELASHVIGYIGRPNDDDLERPGVQHTDLIGKIGVEREYDDLLRGTPGLKKYQVDAKRNVLEELAEQSPEPGGSLLLTIDLDIQRVLEESLAEGLALSRSQYDPDCVPGEDDPQCPVRAVGVVLDVEDGSVLAMASVPTYDPNIFVGGLSEEEFAAFPEGAFTNSAVQGQYAPASTFKAVTYVTSLEESVHPREAASEETRILCAGQLDAPFTDRSQLVWRNWTQADDGEQNIHEAFMRSCNVYFWDVALNIWDTYKDTPNENMLQEWARELGFGAETEIDLPFEREGIVPDRALYEDWAENSPLRLDPARLELASPWLGGDLLLASVGQGTVLVTPLQLANAYAAMVNGGTLWQPRVVDQVVDSDGEVIFENPKKLIREVEIDRTTVLSLRRDLQQVVNHPRGTASAAFADFGTLKEQVGGKTGTAEIIKGEDGVSTALFAGVAPISDPKYVVVIVMERGGSGGKVAAPTAKPILQYLMNGPDGVTPIILGEDAD